VGGMRKSTAFLNDTAHMRLTVAQRFVVMKPFSGGFAR